MRQLTTQEIDYVSGGQISWNEGKTAILVLAGAGLAVGTGAVGVFGLMVWASMAYVDKY